MKDHDDTTSKARLRLWLRLLKVTRMIEGEVRENLRSDHDTTLPRFDVMAALYAAPGGLRMSDLSGRLRVSNGNVTGIVDRLASDGLVTRDAVEGDRRAFRVRLTEQGGAIFAGLAAAHETWIDDLLAAADATAADDLSTHLDTIADQIDKRTRT